MTKVQRAGVWIFDAAMITAGIWFIWCAAGPVMDLRFVEGIFWAALGVAFIRWRWFFSR